MSASLFTSETPSSGDLADASPGLTLATVIIPDADGNIVGIRYYYPATLPSVALVGLLYSYIDESSGSELARATFASPTAGTWNTVTFSSPVAVTASTKYVAAIFTTDRYVATNSFFASAGLTNGHLSSPQDGAVKNGRFHQSGAAAYPESSFSSSCYFVDVLYDISSGTNAPAGEADATAAAPSPTIAIAPAAGNATATAAAYSPTIALSAAAGAATATATAPAATPSLTIATGAAAATAAAHSPTAAVYANAGCATATAAAYGALGASRDIDFIVTSAPEMAWRTGVPQVAWAAGRPEM